MHDGYRGVQAPSESVHELRRQADLRDDHETLPAGSEFALDAPQVDLGLATARDPVQQEGPIATRGSDRVDRMSLRRARLRPGRARKIRIQRLCGVCVARETLDVSFLLEHAQRAPPRRAGGGELRAAQAIAMIPQQGQQSTLHRRAPRDFGRVDGGARPGQAPGGLTGDRGGRSFAQCRGQCRRDDLAGWMVIVVRGPLEEVHAALVEQCFVVEERDRTAKLARRYVRGIADFADDTDSSRPSERHRDSLPALPGRAGGRRQIVE